MLRNCQSVTLRKPRNSASVSDFCASPQCRGSHIIASLELNLVCPRVTATRRRDDSWRVRTGTKRRARSTTSTTGTLSHSSAAASSPTR